MSLPTAENLADAADIVYRTLAPTPQYRWPLLAERLGAPIWVKHENHTPIGAFKVRGGLVYVERLLRSGRPAGLCSATRGNHGQSLAFAAGRAGLPVTIVVPHGNSREKNAAMRALGAELIEHGEDFQAAREYVGTLAAERGLAVVPAFHLDLVAGVASYCTELLRAVPTLDRVYVPVGMGSGISAMLAAKAALQHPVEVVGIVSSAAPAYAHAFATGECLPYPVSTELADGMACRQPDPAAVALMRAGVSRFVQVSDQDIAAAMRLAFETTHQVVEGAGAAGLAAAWHERHELGGREVALVFTGGNIDRDLYARQL